MHSGLHSTAEQRTGAYVVYESASVSACKEPVGEAEEHSVTPGKAERFQRQYWSNKAKPVKIELWRIICHNFSGVGHIQRSCPSPRKPKQHAPTTTAIQVQWSHVLKASKMVIKIQIHGFELYALRDSGVQRNILPIRHFNVIPN